MRTFILAALAGLAVAHQPWSEADILMIPELGEVEQVRTAQSTAQIPQ
jgi:LPS O-antigen subunit length determinant protein (WzzB/FepE family)